MIATMLLEVCKNPKHPGFNHFLFESVAALIKHGTKADPGMIAQFEQMLFPAFQHVLGQDVQEFHPYVFQIFAQLIEIRTPPLPEVRSQLAMLPNVSRNYCLILLCILGHVYPPRKPWGRVLAGRFLSFSFTAIVRSA